MSFEAVDPREARAAFLLQLRARGISDLAVLRAVEMAPRELFVPHRYADLANRDIALPIACGQTMPEPFFVARMMEALEASPEMRVLEIGAGSGYSTAILAQLTREVLAVERFQSLAIAAKARLARLAIGNAGIVWGDGLDLSPHLGAFDRILAHASVDGHEQLLFAMLAPGGFVVGGHGAPQRLAQLRPARSSAWTITDLGPARLQPLLPGRSREL